MFSPLKRLLSSSIQRAGISKEVEAVRILEEFNHFVKKQWGSKFLEKIKPLYVKDKALTIHCFNSVLAQEIKLKEIEIIAYINRRSGKRAIMRLRYQI